MPIKSVRTNKRSARLLFIVVSNKSCVTVFHHPGNSRLPLDLLMGYRREDKPRAGLGFTITMGSKCGQRCDNTVNLFIAVAAKDLS